MKDSERRGKVLQGFYDHRMDGQNPFRLPVPEWFDGELEEKDVFRICTQLGEQGLLEWKKMPMQNKPLFGFGCITAKGVDVIEKTAPAPSGIAFPSMTYNITNNVGTAGSVVNGHGNSVSVSVSVVESLEQEADQLHSSDASAEGKPSFMQIFGKRLGVPIVVRIIGDAAHDLISRIG